MLAARHPSQVRRVVASGANFSPDGIRATTLPKAFLWIILNCGHDAFDERPDLVQRVVLEFLGER